MDALWAFIIASIVSIWGSLQLGMVNTAVVETTLSKGKKSAFFLALGGILPEIPYSLIALMSLRATEFLNAHKILVSWIIGVILLLIGFYYFRKSQKDATKNGRVILKTSKRRTDFVKGLFLALLNPQLILFWSGIVLLIQSGTFDFLTSSPPLINFDADGYISPKIAFSLGTATGAFAILLAYIQLTSKFRHKVKFTHLALINKLVGLFFIFAGIYAIAKTFF